MPTESSALQELKNLINQSSQEIEALTKSIEENNTVDILITTQVLRTLHSIKGLANLCGLPQAATIAHASETMVDNLAKNKIPASKETMQTLNNANNVLFSILQHGEPTLTQTIHDVLQKLGTNSGNVSKQEPSLLGHPELACPPKPLLGVGWDPGSKKINFSAFGLIEGDLVQLGETEKLMINQLFDKKRPIIGFLVHVNVAQLEKNIEKTEAEITANGSLISIIPTHSRKTDYRFAFVFIFTTALSPNDLTQALSLPGKITWVEKDEPIKSFDNGIQLEEKNDARILQDGLRPPQDERITNLSISDKQEPKNTNFDKAHDKLPSSARPDPDPVEWVEGYERKTTTTTTLTADMLEKMRWEKKEDPILHIPLSKIDSLIDQNNKLLSSKIKLQKLIKKLKTEDKKWQTINALENQVFLLDKHLKLLQQGILNARLVKVEEVFDNLSRLVKNIAQESDKKIDFQLTGKTIEIDRSILENLQNPIMHLIKNAADHGIKKPEERLQQGKPDQGLIKVTFKQQEDSVLVSVADDGDGLNIKAIKKKALDLKLIDPIKAATMTDEEFHELIFIPGFSTKETLTQTSGRGIGMDAVKNTIMKMHGQLTLTSTPGQGTIFTITVPTYLSIQRLLRFAVHGQHYALPFSHILEVLLFDQSYLQHVGATLLYTWQTKPLRTINLETILPITSLIASTESTQPLNVIIFKKTDQPIALLVDEIFGQEEIIVRPLEQAGKKEFELYTGYADFGDDKLVLLINVEKLWEIIGREDNE